MAFKKNLMKPLILFGDGATARMMRYQFERIGRKVVAYVVDDAFLRQTTLEELPVIPLGKLQETYPSDLFDCFIAIGPVLQNKLRTERLGLLESMGYGIASYVSDEALVAKNIKLSTHIRIGERSICQPFVHIGRNVFIGSGCLIGHDSQIADNCFFASGVITGGGVRIGENCFLGTGSILRNDIVLGRNVTIGAGVTLLEDAPDDAVYISNTALRLPRRS
jgi:sugar O-acyltransferase (sialic acid O-acetyltransferase NeuD family)